MMVQAGVPPSQPLGTAIPTRDGYVICTQHLLTIKSTTRFTPF